MDRTLDRLFIIPTSWMDEEAKGVLSVVSQWAEKEILSKRLDYLTNYQTLFIEKQKKLLLDIGLQRLALNSEAGGFGWDDAVHAPGLACIISEISRADPSLGIISAMQYAALAPLMKDFGSNKKLIKQLAKAYMDNKLYAPTLILPGAGYAGEETPLFKGRSILAKAKPVKKGFVISGKDLRPATNGNKADLFCAVCSGKDSKTCIAYIPGDLDGIKRGAPIKTTGLNACTNSDISFDDVVIPKENLIAGDQAVEWLYTWFNLLSGSVSIGAALNFYEILHEWSSTRVIKGSTLFKENPLCASVLAEVSNEIALSRMLIHDLASLIAKPDHWGDTLDGTTKPYTFSQMINTRVQQGVMNAINRGMELMGSAGYAKEWHVEKLWRDVKTIQSMTCSTCADVPARMDTATYFFDCRSLGQGGAQ